MLAGEIVDSPVIGAARCRGRELRGCERPLAEESSDWYSVDWRGAGMRFFLWLKPWVDFEGSCVELLRLWERKCGDSDLSCGSRDEPSALASDAGVFSLLCLKPRPDFRIRSILRRPSSCSSLESELGCFSRGNFRSTDLVFSTAAERGGEGDLSIPVSGALGFGKDGCRFSGGYDCLGFSF
jgi:hypothetical protein